MRNVSPIVIFSGFLTLFLLGDVLLIFFLAKINKLNLTAAIVLGLIALLLGYIIYKIHFGSAVSKQQELAKDRLSYTEQYLILDHVLLQEKETIQWGSVEAVFLSNSPPLEGEYHNFEYLFILNTKPSIARYKDQSWYNKMSFLPQSKSKKYPIIRINDHRNKDFFLLKDAINTHLAKNDTLDYYLGLKFGNEVKTERIGHVAKTYSEKPLKTLGFYKIFDRNNQLDDETLIRLRKEAQNQ